MHLRPSGAAWPRRAAGAAIAACVLSALVVVGAPPTLVAAQGPMVTATTHVDLHPRRTPGASSATAVGDLDTHARTALTAPHRSRAIEAVDAFVLLGVTVTEAPTDPILVRARQGTTWTPWSELSFAEDEGPDAGTTPARPGVHSLPLWMGRSDGYEIDAPDAVEALDVHLVREESGNRRLVAAPAAAAAATPTVLSRAAWGARPAKATPTIAPVLKIGVVHHSVGGNTYSAAQVPSVLRAIQAYHQDANGWSDFAYNFAVDRFGRTWEGHAGGIDEIVVGGHSRGFNTGSVGVVVLGDFRSAAVPSAAVEAVANVISWKFALHHVYPSSAVAFKTITGSAKYPPGTTVTLPRIVGHRNVQATDCPGNQLYARLGSIRTRVAQLWPGHRARTLGRDTVGMWEGSWISRTNSTTGSSVADERDFGLPGDRMLSGDWDGDGIDTLGVHRGREFVTTDQPDGSGPYTTVAYGIDTDTPLVGDWDGNGTDTIGIRRGSWFHLRNSITSGAAEVSFSYGVATDTPVIGDWDGNVSETPGVRRGKSYHLRNSSSSGPGQISFSYGTATDVPITGDWDGNGTDTPGVQRGTWFHLRNSNSSGVAQVSYQYGWPSGAPLIGDWDGR